MTRENGGRPAAARPKLGMRWWRQREAPRMHAELGRGRARCMSCPFARDPVPEP